jgi:hypothetical protein
VTDRTVRNWLQRADFREAVEDALRDIHAATIRKLIRNANKALDWTSDLLDDRLDKSMRSGAAVTAAMKTLDIFFRQPLVLKRRRTRSLSDWNRPVATRQSIENRQVS